MDLFCKSWNLQESNEDHDFTRCLAPRQLPKYFGCVPMKTLDISLLGSILVISTNQNCEKMTRFCFSNFYLKNWDTSKLRVVCFNPTVRNFEGGGQIVWLENVFPCVVLFYSVTRGTDMRCDNGGQIQPCIDEDVCSITKGQELWSTCLWSI